VPSSSIVLTARSGRAALKHRLELLGYKVEGEELNTVYENFLVVADEKKEVNDGDLITIVASAPVLSRP
jgi:2-isopropylmalate synthase